MFSVLKFYKRTCFQTKNYFCCGYTTIVIILAIILPIVKLGNTKPIATIWYFYQQKYWVIKSLSGHPKKCFCKTMALRKNPGGKGGVLVHRRICEKYHLWKNPGGKGGALSTGGFVRRIIFGKRVCFQK